MKLILTLGLVLLAAPLAAQSLPASLTFATAATADWVSTVQAIHRGGVEANPLIAWAGTPTHIVAVGVAEDALGFYLVQHFLAPHHPRLLSIGLYASSALRIGLMQSNRHVRPL
jgi:hypothetical protein